MVNRHKLGLVVGGFFAFMHLLRTVLIGIMPTAMQKFINWVLALHYVNPVPQINPDYVTFGHGITLVILAGVVGYIIGSVLSVIWNLIMKK